MEDYQTPLTLNWIFRQTVRLWTEVKVEIIQEIDFVATVLFISAITWLGD